MARSGSFFEQVYAAVRGIPAGRVPTYGQVARLLGVPRGARAVGWALRALAPRRRRGALAPRGGRGRTHLPRGGRGAAAPARGACVPRACASAGPRGPGAGTGCSRERLRPRAAPLEEFQPPRRAAAAGPARQDRPPALHAGKHRQDRLPSRAGSSSPPPPIPTTAWARCCCARASSPTARSRSRCARSRPASGRAPSWWRAAPSAPATSIEGVTEQVQEIIYSLFHWEDGELRVLRRATCPRAR